MNAQQKREAYLKCLDILAKLYYSCQINELQYNNACKDLSK